MRNSSKDIVPRTTGFFTGAARRIVAAGAAGMITLSLVACGAAGTTDTQSSATENAASEQVYSRGATEDAEATVALEGAEDFSIDTSSLFSDRDLDATYDESKAVAIKLSDAGTTSANGVAVDGSTVTISAEGTYVVSGSLSDGRLVVDVPDTQKVQLVLDGVTLSSSTGTALYVKSADKVFVTLAKDSANAICATGDSTEEDDHTLDGAVYACDDLTVNGEGSLAVVSDKGSGIVAKDELTLVSGTYEVTAGDHAIQAKDSLAVKDGTYTLKAGSDGVHVEHDSDGKKGFAYVAGGTWNIEAGSDGFDTSNDLLVDGGTIVAAAADDGLHSEYDIIINAGTIRVSNSYEGLEGARIQIGGGDVDVVASDDGLNATGNPDGTTADDAWQPPQAGELQEGVEPPQAGEIPQTGELPEGVEPPKNGQPPQAGELPEGVEPPQADEMPERGMGGRPSQMGSSDGPQNMRQGGGGSFECDDTASITVTGGKVVVTSDGDGIDSNGDFVVTGGEVYVNGPTSDFDGAIDVGGEATVNGGTVVAVGSAGMAQGFGSASAQGTVSSTIEGAAGETVEVKDASGKVLATFAPAKSFKSIVASAPGMQRGETYTISVGSQSVEANA